MVLGAAGCRRGPSGEAKPRVTVAAASDLATAFGEVGYAYQASTGETVTFAFGSSGQLAKQIAEGAPYDVFAAADIALLEPTIRSGACDERTRARYGRGRVGVWTAEGVTPVKGLADLAQPRFKTVAIANPEHAPYGRAAKQAMARAGLAEALAPKLVTAQNVQQALEFARSGNADAALVALSLAVSLKSGTFVLIDDRAHDPLDQALIVCRRGANSAGGQRFADFVESPTGRTIMRRYGFTLPGEASSVAP